MHPPWSCSETVPHSHLSLNRPSGPVRSVSGSPTPSSVTNRDSTSQRKATMRELSPSAPFYARRSRQPTEAEGGRSDGSEYDMNTAEYTGHGTYKRTYDEEVDELDDDDYSEECGPRTPPVQYAPTQTTHCHLDSVSEIDGVGKARKTIRGGGGTAHDVWHFFDKHTRSCALCQ